MKNGVIGVFLAALLASPAFGQSEDDGDGISVELNKLETLEEAGGCRAYLLLENDTQDALESLRLDLVMFDADSIVAKRLAVEAAPLAAGKTSLKVFDIDGLACDDIGQILLNNVLACRDGSGERDDCLDRISASSRADVRFLK